VSEIDKKVRKAHNRERYIIDDKIRCPACDQWKPLGDFHKWSEGLYGASRYCKLCSNEKARKNHELNRSKGTDGWEVHRRAYRNRYYKKTYGITLEQFEDIFKAQDCKCAICFCPLDIDEESSKAHLDHNHATGKIRQILCVRCNKGIGYLQEDTEILESAINYINFHKEGL
jgi:hypothetical protein